MLVAAASETGKTSVVDYYIDRGYLERVRAITRTNGDIANPQIE